MSIMQKAFTPGSEWEKVIFHYYLFLILERETKDMLLCKEGGKRRKGGKGEWMKKKIEKEGRKEGRKIKKKILTIRQ